MIITIKNNGVFIKNMKDRYNYAITKIENLYITLNSLKTPYRYFPIMNIILDRQMLVSTRINEAFVFCCFLVDFQTFYNSNMGKGGRKKAVGNFLIFMKLFKS